MCWELRHELSQGICCPEKRQKKIRLRFHPKVKLIKIQIKPGRRTAIMQPMQINQARVRRIMERQVQTQPKGQRGAKIR